MTLKELITQVSFDELLPTLKTLIRGNENSLFAFREAYDLLRTMEPNPEYKGKVEISWSGDSGEEENYQKGEDDVLCVCYLDDDAWENELAKELVIDKSVNASLAEIAANCLWEITFYGFSPKEITHTFDRMLGRNRPQNKYEIALDKLEESIWKHQTPKRLRSRGPEGQRCTTLEFPLRLGDRRMNRAKRKREYRQKRRRDYLEKMSARENLVQSLSAPGSSFVRSDVAYLLEVEYGKQYDYTAVVNGTEGRLQYILESMTKYQQLDLSWYDNAIVCIKVSSRYPLSEDEIEDFKIAVRVHLKYDDIRFGLIQTDADQAEVEVKLLLNKMEK